MEHDMTDEITPESKLGALIDRYPQLEEVLVTLSPAFKKLRNPVLRRTVAKVASLRQVAKVGDISLAHLVNELRKAVGQDVFEGASVETAVSDTPPAWFDSSIVEKSFDARPIIEAGRNPMKEFFAILDNTPGGRICRLVTSFLPAPLIGVARGKQYETWSIREEEELFSTYFIRLKDGE